MTMPIEKPDGIIRPDLAIAIISLLLVLVAKPLFADTASGLQPGGSINPTSINPTMTATPSPPAGTSQSQSTYLNPPTAAPVVTPGSSQSQRDASARQNQNGTNLNPQLQPLPECKIEDSACIEQRNRMNQTNPQTAPTFNR